MRERDRADRAPHGMAAGPRGGVTEGPQRAGAGRHRDRPGVERHPLGRGARPVRPAGPVGHRQRATGLRPRSGPEHRPQRGLQGRGDPGRPVPGRRDVDPLTRGSPGERGRPGRVGVGTAHPGPGPQPRRRPVDAHRQGPHRPREHPGGGQAHQRGCVGDPERQGAVHPFGCARVGREHRPRDGAGGPGHGDRRPRVDPRGPPGPQHARRPGQRPGQVTGTAEGVPGQAACVGTAQPTGGPPQRVRHRCGQGPGDGAGDETGPGASSALLGHPGHRIGPGALSRPAGPTGTTGARRPGRRRPPSPPPSGPAAPRR